MAERFVPVVAPDGEAGEIPESQLEAALASGFQVAQEPAAMQPSEQFVQVVAPDGELGDIPLGQLERALASGFRTPDDVALEREYGDLGSQVVAGFEGVAKGLSLGARTPIAAVEALGATIGDRVFEASHPDAGRVPYEQRFDEAQREVALRQEFNPVTSGAGEVVGVVAPALASGGLSLAPSGAVAGAGAALAGRVTARIAPSALRGLARPAAGLLTQGAVEGAAYAAAREVDDAVLLGDYEGLAERALGSGFEGLLYGALGSAAGGGLVAGGRAAVTGAARAAGRIVPSMRKLAGDSAYKAAVGRTSKTAIQAAERHGGAEAVGQTLLDEGIPLTGAADEIYAAVEARANEVGHELASLRNQVDELSGGKGMSKTALWDRVSRSVIAPLRANPINRDLGDQMARWLRPLKDTLTRHATKPVPLAGPSRVGALRESLAASKGALSELQTKLGAATPQELDAIEAATRTLYEQGDQIAALESRMEGLHGAARAGVERKLTRLRESFAELAEPLEGRVGDAIAARGEVRALEARLEGLRGAPRKALEAKLEQARTRLQGITGTVAGGARKSVQRKLGQVQTQVVEIEELLARDLAADEAQRAAVRAADDRITFERLHELRRAVDERIGWHRFAPDVALEARKNLRNTIEDFWIESAEDVAAKAGDLGYGERLRSLKQRYARLALARDQAEQSVITQLANRSTSLSDTIAGAAAGGAAGDPITGFLASQLHKLVRERGRGYVAVGLNRLANAIEGRLSDNVMTVAAQAQRRVNTASTLKGLLLGVDAPKAARTVLTFEQVDAALAAFEPGSDERNALEQLAAHVAEDSPELAAALRAQVDRVSAFILSKAPPAVDTPFGRRVLRDVATNRKLARYIDAASNPVGALERLAAGEVLAEDVEALQKVAPALLEDLQRKADATLFSADEPSREKRARLAFALGFGMEPSQTGAGIAFYQQLAAAGSQAQQEQNTRPPARATSFKTHGDAYETKAQRLAQ